MSIGGEEEHMTHRSTAEQHHMQGSQPSRTEPSEAVSLVIPSCYASLERINDLPGKVAYISNPGGHASNLCAVFTVPLAFRDENTAGERKTSI